jgi:transposase
MLGCQPNQAAAGGRLAIPGSLEAARADRFGLPDEPWAVIEPFLPKDRPGPEKDDRQIISGILHGLTSGRRWHDGPGTTVYNRVNRWSRRGFRKAMRAARAEAGWAVDATALDSSYVGPAALLKAERGGRRRGPTGARAVA